jgi:hypothetical protein
LPPIPIFVFSEIVVGLFLAGIKSRVFYSGDKGKTWKVYETPIIQGDVMTGIFTVDFYNKKNWFIWR